MVHETVERRFDMVSRKSQCIFPPDRTKRKRLFFLVISDTLRTIPSQLIRSDLSHFVRGYGRHPIDSISNLAWPPWMHYRLVGGFMPSAARAGEVCGMDNSDRSTDTPPRAQRIIAPLNYRSACAKIRNREKQHESWSFHLRFSTSDPFLVVISISFSTWF